MERMRRSDIDFYKGILVWLVVISHIMAINEYTSSSFAFKLICNSHIPLFLMISGFLFNPEKLLSISWIRRMIIPWLIANVIYLLMPGSSFSIRGIIVGFTTHLWYIPGITVYMVIVWGMFKLFRRDVAFAILLVISVMFYFIGGIPGDSIIIRVLRFCISNFRLQFLIYFLVGYIDKIVKYEIKFSGLCLALGALFLVIASLINMLNGIFQLAGNIMLMVSMLKLNINLPTNNRFIGFLSISGRNSMFIYLWHVVPLALPMSNSLKLICMLVWLIALSFIMCTSRRKAHASLVGLA